MLQLNNKSAMTVDQELEIPQNYTNPPQFQPDVPAVDLEEAIGIRAEQNYIAAEGRRWHNQHRFMGKENEQMRLTGILHAHDVFRKLRRAGVDARLEAPSYYVWMADDHTGQMREFKKERSTGRIWLHDYAIAGRVGVSAWVKGKRRMVTTLQYPYGPEWSLMRFDEFDVPQTEKYRGWRTAMLSLILENVLTEAEVDRAFGPVALSPVSLIYREALYVHRQRKAGLIQ